MSNLIVNGLVMAGGNSSRMGRDKSQLIYQEFPQYQVVYDLLQNYCNEVFISAASEESFPLPVIVDNSRYTDSGPIAGILSAFECIPSAWLIVAIDYPSLAAADIEKIINERTTELDATVYMNEEGYYEPLIGLYENSFYPILKQAFDSGNTSIQSVLKANQIKPVKAVSETVLTSIDTFEDYQKFMKNHHAKQ